MSVGRTQTRLSWGPLRAWSMMLAVVLSLVGPSIAAQESGSVSGVVVDEQGNAIANARVVVTGTNLAVLTDAEGNFRIVGLPATGSVSLRVTILGFRPTTETVDVGSGGIRLEMTRAAISLDAYVVTGTAAGVQEARAIGNTVSTVNAEQLLEVAPIPDVSNIINGRAPGVVVTQGTGQVGSGPNIRIRGASSFSLGNQPLIYVDGVRINNTMGAGINVQGFGSGIVNRLNDIQPKDIESIEIIKGPAAATLYGTEASNGVIQIITKRGRAGQTDFTLSTKQGTRDFANAGGRIQKNWAFEPGTTTPFEQDLFALEKERGNPPIFTTGYQSAYGGSIRGGTEAARYFAAIDVDLDNGVEPDNYMDRYSVRANVTADPSPAFDLTASVGYQQGKIGLACEAGCGGRMWATVFANAWLRDDPDFRGFRSYPPEIITEAVDFWQDISRLQYSFQMNHRPVNWLSHRLTVGQDRVEENNVELWERLDPDKFGTYFGSFVLNGFKFRQDREINTWTFDYSATFSAAVSRSIKSSTTVGAQYYKLYEERTAAEGQEFPAPGLNVIDAAATTFGGDWNVENNTLGFFLQEQISFNDRIFLTGAIRADDNSAFGRDFNVVVYPKVSATWVISEERFWGVNWIDALKLRAAYGQSGQQPGYFDAVRTYSPVTAGNGSPAATPDVFGNDSLGPEVGAEFEVGFETGLFNSRIGLDVTYYNTRTRDAILSQPLAPSAGFPGNVFVNAGTIANSGFEVQMSAIAVQQQNFGLDLTLNLATNSNKIVDLGGVDQGQGFLAAGSQMRVPGLPVATYFDQHTLSATLNGTGYDARAENAMCDAGDPNGHQRVSEDGTQTPTQGGGSEIPCDGAPRLALGNSIPTFEGSFGATITFLKNFRLYALLDWKQGHTKFDNNARARCQVFWQCRENFFPEEYDPAYVAEFQSPNTLRSFVFSNASYAKIRELSLTWTLPPRVIPGTKRASITIAGRNLVTFSGYSGLDPEAEFLEFGFSVLEQDNLPNLRSFVANIVITF